MRERETEMKGWRKRGREWESEGESGRVRERKNKREGVGDRSSSQNFLICRSLKGPECRQDLGAERTNECTAAE